MRLVAPADVAREVEEKLRAGGYGYGSLKKDLFGFCWEYFADAREKRAELAANLDYVEGVLKRGAERAREVAADVLARAKKAAGLD